MRARRWQARGEGWAACVEALIAASPERADPPCPHFGVCGGCTLQHWQDAPYRAWKAGLLEAALRRAGYAAAIAPLAATPPGTRRRMDLALRRQGGAVLVGLHAARAAEVVDLPACPVLHPALFALIAPLRAALRGSGAAAARRLGGGEPAGQRAPICCCAPTPRRIRPTGRALADFARAHGLCRISWARRRRRAPETLCLLRPPVAVLSGVAVRPPPGAFLQASREGEAAIVAAVLAGLPAKLPARARVADLYAGCGTLSFALAPRARVAAYRGRCRSAAALRAAATRRASPGGSRSSSATWRGGR